MISKRNKTQLHSNTNQILKKVWKYVNSKSKYIEKIGDLKVTDEQVNTVICSSAKTKADSLCNFFGTVLCNETDDDFEPLPEKTVFRESTPILVSEHDVLGRLNKLNINK